MSTIKADKTSPIYYINILISLLLMFGFQYLPAPAPMTVLGMKITGIFLGAIYAWCTVGGFVWASILALALLGLTGGYGTVGEVYTKAFGHPIVLMVFFLMIFAAIVEKAGLTKLMAEWFVSRKFVQGRPWALTFMILMAAFIASSFVSMVPAILICWLIVYNVCEQVGYKRGDKWPALMVFSIVFIATMGSVLLPFQIGVISNFGFLTKASQGTLSYQYGEYLLFSIIYTFFIVGAYFLLLKYVFKPDITPFLNNQVEFAETKKMTSQQKMTVWILVILVIALMAPTYLPKGFVLRNLAEGLGTTALAALVIGLAAFLRIEGKPFIDIQEMIFKGVSWNLIFMLAAAYTVAGALTSQETGVIPWFMSHLQPVLAVSGPYGFVILMALIAVVATNIINNIVVAAVTIPMVYGLSGTIGINPVAVTALLVFVIDFGILLPSSSPSGALLHGNRDWLSAKQILGYGSATVIFMMILTLIIGIPLANAIFTY